MSHVTNIDIEISNLNALESAIQEMGGTFLRDKKNYTWYGRHVGDYPLPPGFTKEMLGKCEHAIGLGGTDYQIGVVRNPAKPKTYTLLYDFWGPGEKLRSHFGDGLTKLKQMYGVHTATAAAKAKGYYVTRKQVGDTIKLQIAV
jgi:hypothetical protein